MADLQAIQWRRERGFKGCLAYRFAVDEELRLPCLAEDKLQFRRAIFGQRLIALDHDEFSFAAHPQRWFASDNTQRISDRITALCHDHTITGGSHLYGGGQRSLVQMRCLLFRQGITGAEVELAFTGRAGL